MPLFEIITRPVEARMGTLCVVCALIGLSIPSIATAAPVMPASPTYAWALDEGTGTTAYPIFGTQDGDLYNGASWSTDCPISYAGNYCAYFGAKRDQVRFPSHLSGASGSMQFWFRSDDMSAGNYYMNTLGSGRSYVYVFGANENSVGYGLNGVLGVGAFPTPPHGIWNHMVITWDESLATDNVNVYITNSNGQSVYSNTKVLGADDTGTICVGSSGSSSGFGGLLDEVAFWNVPLSADNVEWLYENSISTIPEPTTATLAVLAAIGLLITRRRRR